jgi:dolichyl-phosphate-mannose-protein mannosyltransferase
MERRSVAAPATVAVISAILYVLWIFAAERNGSLRQVPYWDLAWFHSQALSTLRSLQDGGILGLADAWAHGSQTHAPLVPTLSALLMWVLGPTRAAAELVLPLFGFVLLLSTFRVAERLFDRATALGSCALLATFPVVLTYSRLYFYEIACAAMVAAAGWALVASRGFSLWKPTIAFGALAGLTALSRAMGFVYLAGPVVVAVAVILGAPDRGWRLWRLAVAALLAAALSATWYAPNAAGMYQYLQDVTLGEHSALYTGSGPGLGIANILYYAEWLVLDGPGVPMLGVAIACAIVSRFAFDARLRPKSPVVALLAAGAIDFAIAAAGAQRMGGKFLLAVMPIVAILIARSVTSLPRWRFAAALAVFGLALHHAIACTFLFSVDPKIPPTDIQRVLPGTQIHRLWNHEDFYLAWVAQTGADPNADYRIPATVDRLEKVPGITAGPVVVLGQHPFFDAGPLQVEALRRRDGLQFWNAASWKSPNSSKALESAASTFNRCVVALHCDSGDPVSNAFGEFLRNANEQARLGFRRLEEPILLGDGSKVWIYTRATSASAPKTR